MHTLLGLKDMQERGALTGEFRRPTIPGYEKTDFGPDIGTRFLPTGEVDIPERDPISGAYRTAVMDVERAQARRAEAQALAAEDASRVARRRVITQLAPTLVGTLFGGPDRSQRVAQAVDTLAQSRVAESLARETAAGEADVAEAAAELAGLTVDEKNKEIARQNEADRIAEYQRITKEFNDTMASVTDDKVNLEDAKARKAAYDFQREQTRLEFKRLQGAEAAAAYQGYGDLENNLATQANAVKAAREAYNRDPNSEEGQEAARFLTGLFRPEDVAQSVMAEMGMGVPWDDQAAQDYILQKEDDAMRAGLARVKTLEDNPYIASSLSLSTSGASGDSVFSGGTPPPEPVRTPAPQVPGGSGAESPSASAIPEAPSNPRWASYVERIRMAHDSGDDARMKALAESAYNMQQRMIQANIESGSPQASPEAVQLANKLTDLLEQFPRLRQHYNQVVSDRTAAAVRDQGEAIEQGTRAGAAQQQQ